MLTNQVRVIILFLPRAADAELSLAPAVLRTEYTTYFYVIYYSWPHLAVTTNCALTKFH